MKKIFVSAMLLASFAIASAQTGQSNTTTTKTHQMHKKTSSASTADTTGSGATMGTTKKHKGRSKGKHNGAAVKETKTTTTTTNPQ